MVKPDQPPAAGPGHNALNDDQLKQLHFKTHIPDYEKALKAKKDADANLKNVCKRIKSEGGNLEDIKLSIQLREPAGEKAFKELLERQRRVAEWNNMPVGQQGWLLDNDPRSLNEKAFAAGEYAGLNNGDPKPPYGPGEAANAWMEGWHKSQGKLLEGIKPTQKAEVLRTKDAPKETKPDDFDSAGETSEEKPWPDDQQTGKPN